jgi:ABC-2 type transport system permease protein
MNNFSLASFTLLQREVVRFLRQRHRIVGAFGTPVVFWILIGSGLGRSFQSPLPGAQGGMNYLRYFYPGTILLILLFTAIFSTISIIEDRREGFLQGVLVAPIPRSAIVMGKLLGGTVLATGQAMLFVIAAPFLGISMGITGVLYTFAILVLVSFGLTGLGFLIAWKLDSTQGFHAIMNLFLMPLWFLSGALFPMAGAPIWLRFVMAVNPLSYGLSGLQLSFFHGTSGSVAALSSPPFCLAVTVAFAALMYALSCRVASQPQKPS